MALVELMLCFGLQYTQVQAHPKPNPKPNP